MVRRGVPQASAKAAIVLRPGDDLQGPRMNSPAGRKVAHGRSGRLDDERGVDAAESEGIRHGGPDASPFGLVRHAVDPAFRVRFEEIDGGRQHPLRRAPIVQTSSRAPAAPRPWPWIGLVEETGTEASSPNIRPMASASVGSLSVVAVPWALT